MALFWILSTFPTYGFWGILGEIWSRKRQKFAFLRAFCALIGHFCALLTVFFRPKKPETKFNKPILPLNRGIAGCFFAGVFLAPRDEGTKVHEEFLATDERRLTQIIFFLFYGFSGRLK